MENLREALHVTQKNGELTFAHFSCYESRCVSLEWLIRKTVEKYEIKENFFLPICAGDWDKHPEHYSFCNAWGSSYDKVVPDWLFHSWPEVGLDDYEKLRTSFIDTKPISDKIGWIGSTNAIVERRRFVDYNSEFTEGLSMDWNRKDPESLHKNTPAYMTYQEQVDRWKYLIDIRGIGFSARTKIFLNSPRITFIVRRPYYEWWFEHAEPWKHFIPVREDLEDLKDAYERIEGDKDLQASILRNQKEFADEHLTREAALKRYRDVIKECINDEV